MAAPHAETRPGERQQGQARTSADQHQGQAVEPVMVPRHARGEMGVVHIALTVESEGPETFGHDRVAVVVRELGGEGLGDGIEGVEGAITETSR
jgi:hypothetical protein